jgi:tetratricopeptide (TPR) repeat protein
MDNADDDVDLDLIGAIEGTDKSSSVAFSWNYLRHYQKFFSSYVNADINLIEIGVGGGRSVEVWRSYFRHATIIGIDDNPACSRFARDRILIEIGSQDDPGFLADVCRRHPPTIVIDDGSHKANHIIYTFERLFPALLSGGLYVIEDLAFHFGRALSIYGSPGFSVPGYLLKRTEALMQRAQFDASVWGTERYIHDHIDTIHYLRGAVIINKAKRSPSRPATQFAKKYIADRSLGAGGWFRYVDYIIKNNGSLEEAERLLHEIEGGERSFRYFKTLAELYRKHNRNKDALSILEQGAERLPHNFEIFLQLARCQIQFKQLEEAEKSLERAATLCPASHRSVAAIHEMLVKVYEERGKLGAAVQALKTCAGLAKNEASRQGYLRRAAALAARNESAAAQ